MTHRQMARVIRQRYAPYGLDRNPTAQEVREEIDNLIRRRDRGGLDDFSADLEDSWIRTGE